MPDPVTAIKRLLKDICLFSEHVSGLRLRSYQREVARAVVDSVVHRKGLTFVVIFPRQSGKNELQAQIETYLLCLLQRTDCEIVKVSPTWKPQAANAMRRLERVLSRNLFTRRVWKKEQGHIYRVGSARMIFLSASPAANLVGATASVLLECDEAQDVLISKWDKDIAPMAASANATRVFWGTAWTSQTLLAREKRLALDLQKRDGVRRVFELAAGEVKAEVPAYGDFVEEEIRRHGRANPFVRSQYFSEEIDLEAGMFPPERLALMQGSHPPQPAPLPGRQYALTIDVGGEDFSAASAGDSPASRDRDATALTIFDIDSASLSPDLLAGPCFRTVFRRVWRGESQVAVFRQTAALIELWNPHRVVVDATGVGEGLASFLLKIRPAAVIPFKFSQASKSSLGWKFLSLIDSGRYKEHAALQAALPAAGQPGGNPAGLQALFWEQCRHTGFEILPGPGKICRWGVPEDARSPQNGLPVHDDLLLSAALVAALDADPWGPAESAVLPAYDPLQEMTF